MSRIVRELRPARYEMGFATISGVLTLFIEEPDEGTRRLYSLDEDARQKLQAGTAQPLADVGPHPAMRYGGGNPDA